jgi:hypothetical protein
VVSFFYVLHTDKSLTMHQHLLDIFLSGIYYSFYHHAKLHGYLLTWIGSNTVIILVHVTEIHVLNNELATLASDFIDFDCKCGEPSVEPLQTIWYVRMNDHGHFNQQQVTR